MASPNPAQAAQVVTRIVQLCEFVDHPAIQDAVQRHVPVSMPQSVGAFGLDVPLWVGFGTVGLWAALDAFGERAGLSRSKCQVCAGWSCVAQRFAVHTQGTEGRALQELEDLRHLYAHNYVGHLDDEYASRTRHVLVKGVPAMLTAGKRFDGQSVQLDLAQLKHYAEVVRSVLARFS